MSKESTPRFDPGSPYTDAAFDVVKGYVRLTVKGHELAASRGRVMAHRAVLFDAVGVGPHDCHWCKVPGLRWDVERVDPSYLVADHVDGDGFNNTIGNVVPAHAWCNNNRPVIDELGIPWSSFEGTPPGDRPALRMKVSGGPTAAALELAGRPASAEVVPVDVPPPVAPESSPPPGEHRMYDWRDFVDKAEMDKDNVRLIGPPEWLLAKHPKLRKVDFTRFGRS